MIRDILEVTNPKLKEVSKEVPVIDKKIKDLIRDLKDTLKVQNDPEGIGLAAPQIGKNVRVFLMKSGRTTKTVINPKILERTEDNQAKQKRKIMEGCLSLPNYYGPIKRAPRLKLEYLDEDGNTQTEEFTGLDAQIVEHETDHLNGILFVNRLIEQKQPLYEYKKGEWEKVDLPLL